MPAVILKLCSIDVKGGRGACAHTVCGFIGTSPAIFAADGKAFPLELQKRQPAFLWLPPFVSCPWVHLSFPERNGRFDGDGSLRLHAAGPVFWKNTFSSHLGRVAVFFLLCAFYEFCVLGGGRRKWPLSVYESCVCLGWILASSIVWNVMWSFFFLLIAHQLGCSSLKQVGIPGCS